MASDGSSVASAKRSAEDPTMQREPCDVRALTDMSLVTLKERKYNGTAFLVVKYDAKSVFVNLAPEDDDWMSIPMGFRVDDRNQEAVVKPIKVSIVLGAEALDVVRVLEAKIKEEVLKIHPNREWNSSLYNELLTVDIGLGTKGEGSGETTFMIRVPDTDAPLQGYGVNFLQPVLDSHFCMQHATVKAAVSLSKVFLSKNNKAGINWRATAMMVDVQPRVKNVWPSTFKATAFPKK